MSIADEIKFPFEDAIVRLAPETGKPLLDADEVLGEESDVVLHRLTGGY